VKVDFFVVGQPKAGTTALYRMLDQHPRIFMPSLKEPQFFAKDMKRRFDPERWPVLPQSMDEYLALFGGAGDDQLLGEASTLYLPSAVAAGEISRFNPEAKIVAVLREPASLLRSLHLQKLKDRNEVHDDLRLALELEGERRQGREIPDTCYRPQELFYVDNVRYVEQLERYDDFDTLVIPYDGLRGDNQATVNEVFRFLDLAEVEVSAVEANPSVVVRSRKASRALRSISTGPTRWAARVVPRKVRRRLLSAAYAKVRPAPAPMDADLATELRERFRSEVVALSEYTGRDFTALWGYS
jgi:hypothetical protein